MPNDKKLDARIVKTLQAIEDAFFAMLAQKNYSDITIADILAEADINRTTFYKYYKNKHDLAEQMSAKLKECFFIPALDKRFSVSWEQFSQYFVELLEINHSKIALLWNITTPSTNLKQDCYHMVKEKYRQAHQNQAHDTDLQSHLYASVTLAIMEYVIQHGILPPSHVRDSLKKILQELLA